MRYLNTTTLKQTTEYLDSTTVIDTDSRVSNWFSKCPDGYKGEWIGDTYTFIEIPPLNVDGTVNPPLNVDGTVNPQGYGLDNLTLTDDGEQFKYYLPDKVDGMYVPDEAKIALELAEAEVNKAKQDKLDALAVLVITTANGNTFDADDVAQVSMMGAIMASDTLSLTEQAWKLADNSWKVIQLAELKEASALASREKGAILAGVKDV